MLAKYTRVLVHRDMAATIPATVFEHEVEVLKDMHGEDKITLDDEQPDLPPVEVDAAEEYDRLVAYYGQSEAGMSHAERVFGRSPKGLEAYAWRKPRKGKAADADPDNGGD